MANTSIDMWSMVLETKGSNLSDGLFFRTCRCKDTKRLYLTFTLYSNSANKAALFEIISRIGFQHSLVISELTVTR